MFIETSCLSLILYIYSYILYNYIVPIYLGIHKSTCIINSLFDFTLRPCAHTEVGVLCLCLWSVDNVNRKYQITTSGVLQYDRTHQLYIIIYNNSYYSHNAFITTVYNTFSHKIHIILYSIYNNMWHYLLSTVAIVVLYYCIILPVRLYLP